MLRTLTSTVFTRSHTQVGNAGTLGPLSLLSKQRGRIQSIFSAIAAVKVSEIIQYVSVTAVWVSALQAWQFELEYLYQHLHLWAFDISFIRLGQ